MNSAGMKIKRARVSSTPPVAPVMNDLIITVSTFSSSMVAGSTMSTVGGKYPGATLSVVPNDGRVVASTLSDTLLRGLSAWSPGVHELVIRQSITIGGVLYEHDTTYTFTVTVPANLGYQKIWPGTGYDGSGKSGWLNASKTIPIPTVFDLITPRPGCRPLFHSFQRINGNKVFCTDGGSVGGLGGVTYELEGRQVPVFEMSWVFGTNDAGEDFALYGYCIEVDHAACMNMLPPGQEVGEMHMFVHAHALNPSVLDCTVGFGTVDTAGRPDGFVIYPTSRPLIDELVYVAKTSGLVHPTLGPADFYGPECIRDAAEWIGQQYKAAPDKLQSLCRGIMIIEQLPDDDGPDGGWRLSRVSKSTGQVLSGKWWMPVMAAPDISLARMGDHTLAASGLGTDMTEFRGRNILMDWTAMSYKISGCYEASVQPGARGGFRLNCVMTTHGPAYENNPYDPTGTKATGSGQSILYGGRQVGALVYPTSSSSPMYYCYEYTHGYEHANVGIMGGHLVIGNIIDGVSGSCFQNVVGGMQDNKARNVGGLGTGLRSHRHAIRLNYLGNKTYQWIEKTSTNSASSAPGTFYVNPDANFYPLVGEKTYPFVALYAGGVTTGRGTSGGFGAKASITVTNGKITAISISDPGIKWNAGETASPVLSATKGQFSYEDPKGSNIYYPGWVDAVSSDIVFTFGSNLNVYESDVNDVNVAIAAGKTHGILLQEQNFTIRELADRINAQWGGNWQAICDDADADVTRYDSPMLSHASSTNAGGIDNGVGGAGKRPRQLSGDTIDLTGVMDIHSDSLVWSSSALNCCVRFTEIYDFKVTAMFSSGTGGRHNGFVVRNLITATRDIGNPQTGYMSPKQYMALIENVTFYNPGGSAGSYVAFGSAYEARTPSPGLPTTVEWSHVLSDDVSWSPSVSPNVKFKALVLVRKDNTRATTYSNGDASSKGLSMNVGGVGGGGDGGIQVYTDPLGLVEEGRWVNDFRPILDGPAKITTGPFAGNYSGAKLPPELYSEFNRGWALMKPDGTQVM